MALIIDQQPQDYSPAFNQQPWVVRETDYTDADITNWRVNAIVWRGTGITDQIATHQLRMRYGTAGRIVLDPMRTIDGDVSYDHSTLPSTLTPWAKAEGSITIYSIWFASQFYDGTQWITKGFVAGSPKYVYNGVFDDLAYVDYDDADYFVASKCLTNAPTTQTIGSNDSLWLHTLTNVNTSPYDMRVVTYNYTGGAIATYTYSNPFADWSGAIIVGSTIFPSDIDKRRRVRVAVGPRDLALLSSPVSFAGVGSYRITFRNSGGFTIGQAYTFTISDCAKYTPTRLHWLNRLGGFDAFTFKLKSKRKRTFDRATFDRQKNVLSAGRYGYTTQSRGTVQYNTDIDWALHIVSDPLTDEQTTWLLELAASPVVFIENADGSYTSVVIMNKDYMLQRSHQDGIHYAEIDLAYALKDRSQRG